MAEGDAGRLDPVGRVELGQDVMDVDVHGARADEELRSDLAVGPARRDELEDHQFAWGELEHRDLLRAAMTLAIRASSSSPAKGSATPPRGLSSHSRAWRCAVKRTAPESHWSVVLVIASRSVIAYLRATGPRGGGPRSPPCCARWTASACPSR